ncbi:hypothetical protein GWI33_014186 [Rhynchophorus ferrugineus]|uniref:Uncharacterized protein n=1 Tax=Rhynchophorus ferrugineus TaxID=354439 RepID=A0A834M9C7_RHYFE|nr:hypothetical protein GWI33_014186 [Rhynchophorus ferrugineus]
MKSLKLATLFGTNQTNPRPPKTKPHNHPTDGPIEKVLRDNPNNSELTMIRDPAQRRPPARRPTAPPPFEDFRGRHRWRLIMRPVLNFGSRL